MELPTYGGATAKLEKPKNRQTTLVVDPPSLGQGRWISLGLFGLLATLALLLLLSADGPFCLDVFVAA